jgi:Ca-activated chloride channel family protein
MSPFSREVTMRSFVMLSLLLVASAAFAAPSIKAPASAPLGGQLTLEATGAGDPRDFVTVVPKGSPEGAYEHYVYVAPGKLQLQLPAKPGEYEVRVLAAASPYKTLARQALRIEGASASVKAAATIKAGAEFEVAWTGPNNERDYVTIGNAERKYFDYKYTRNGSPTKLTAPDKVEEYEVRYILGEGDTIIATRR